MSTDREQWKSCDGGWGGRLAVESYGP